MTGRWIATVLLVAVITAACASTGEGQDAAGTSGQTVNAPTTPSSDGQVLDIGGEPVPEPTFDFDEIDRTVTITITEPDPPPIEIPEPEPEQCRTTEIVISEQVLFATGESDLQSAADTVLQDLADSVNELETVMDVVVVGHTDSRGSTDDNLALSLGRAEAVASRLVENGLAEDLVSAVPRGESELLLPDTDEDGAFLEEAGAQNRRVAVQLTGSGC